MDDDPAVTTAEHRVIGRPILPGQRLNPHGRPKGSRAKLAQKFLDDLYESWQTGGADAIRRVMDRNPEKYLAIIARVVPHDIEAERQNTVILVPSEATDVRQWLKEVTPPVLDVTHEG
jgi:hypothetical protein